MSDDLLVGGGGAIAVATVALFDQVARLERLESSLEECARILGAMDAVAVSRLPGTASCRPALEQAGRGVDDARALLGLAAVRSAHLASGLRLSAKVYGAGESALAAFSERLAGDFAAGLGFLAARFGLLVAPGLLLAGSRVAVPFTIARTVAGTVAGTMGSTVANTVAGTVASTAANTMANTVASHATRRSPGAGADAAERWLAGHKAMLSDPRFVQLARVSIVSLDEFGAGAVGLPVPVVRLLGEDGLGLLGLDTTVGAVAVGASVVGAFRETGVRTAPVATTPSTPAEGFADRAARVPSGSAQVRVDRYSAPGQQDRFEVYLGGTADFSPMSGKEPFDLTSNITALSAGGQSGAYRAVEDALGQAGVGPHSPLVVTGYSQGGLVAAQLAASGDYDVRGLYTLGAPSGQVDVPRDVQWVAVEHTDDLVPALGGTWATADPVLVRRKVFSDVAPPPELALPAHAAEQYRATAALIDAANESRLREAGAAFDLVGRGAESVESTWYRASRVP